MIDERDRSLADLEDVVERSLAARAMLGMVRPLQAAADSSSAVRFVRQSWQRLAALPLAERLRLAGVALLAFSASNLALAAMMPEASAPAFPAFVWGPIALVGVALAWGGRTLAAAWTSRRP